MRTDLVHVSGVASTVRRVNQPPVWRWLRALPQVSLEFHRGGPRGRVSHTRQTVSVREGLTAAERREVLVHELLHLDRGPVPVDLKAKEEEQVRRATAQYLLNDVDAIADALSWALSTEEAAHELGVSVLVLAKRLQHLHPAERGQLARRLTGLDESRGC